ncbi:hypothetical protein F4802DRAFT_598339 [Xylaria palmicola]|nr:hypothetical protein F4802DRAFT_598339 [Xylaria palmicola]
MPPPVRTRSIVPQLQDEKYSRLLKLKEDVTTRYVKQEAWTWDESFLPADALDELVTEESVLSVLQETRIEKPVHWGLASWVVESGKKVFLILVLMTRKTDEKLSCLECLKYGGVDDSVLPLDFKDDGCAFPKDKPHDEPELTTFKNWDLNDRLLFESHQWRLLAPIFCPSDDFYYQLYRQQPLPYLTKPVCFGTIWRADIHPAHIHQHCLSDLGIDIPNSVSNGISVAIKKAKNSEYLAEFFEGETKTMEKLLETISPHLKIWPIATYQRGEERCLIFRWVDSSNLVNHQLRAW